MRAGRCVVKGTSLPNPMIYERDSLLRFWTTSSQEGVSTFALGIFLFFVFLWLRPCQTTVTSDSDWLYEPILPVPGLHFAPRGSFIGPRPRPTRGKKATSTRLSLYRPSHLPKEQTCRTHATRPEVNDSLPSQASRQ